MFMLRHLVESKKDCKIDIKSLSAQKHRVISVIIIGEDILQELERGINAMEAGRELPL